MNSFFQEWPEEICKIIFIALGGAALALLLSVQPAVAADGPARDDSKVAATEPGLPPEPATPQVSYDQIPNAGAPSAKGKLERTAGKYDLRFYGTILVNLSVSDSQQVGQDVPLWPVPGDDPVPTSNGTSRRAGVVGETLFTLRQSVMGFEFNRSESRDGGWSPGGLVEMDFFDSRPVDLGLQPKSQVLNWPRFRRGYFQLQRGTWRILAGQEQAIIAPLDPYSLSHVAVPLGASAGNLWGWLPQARIENSHTWGGTTALFQMGALWPSFRDPVLNDLSESYGDAPASSNAGLTVQRRQPFYQARVALSRPKVGGVTTVGLGVHYGRERVGTGQIFDSWALAADYSVPIFPRLTLRGEAYTGSNLSPFDGGIIQGVSASPDEPPFTTYRAVHDMGGWAECAVPVTLDFRNVIYLGAGTDDPHDGDLLPAAPRSKNSFLWASYFRRLADGLTLAVEWSYWDFQYREFSPAGQIEERGVPGRGNVFNLALAYQF